MDQQQKLIEEATKKINKEWSEKIRTRKKNLN